LIDDPTNPCDCVDPCADVPHCGHYLSIFGGYSDIDNFERTLETIGTTNILGARLDDDWCYGLSIGRQYHPHGRIEFEYTYRENGVQSWFENEFDNTGLLVSSTVSPAVGDMRLHSGVINLLFDLYDRQLGRPGLYLGGGIGSIYIDSAFTVGPTTYDVDDTSFAYQFIGGVNYPVSQRVDLYTEYRYLGADYLDVDDVTNVQSLGDFTIDVHHLFFGARIRW
jgi:opacity protein-like surface antigen